MALPLAPVAVVAARYGAVALAAYAISRKVNRSQTRQSSEDALDQVPEGLGAHRPKDRQQVNAEARWRWIIRRGQNGPGLGIDATVLSRLKFRRV